jgi:two-component system, OmpR family, KDP operon response regulator KdpE
MDKAIVLVVDDEPQIRRTLRTTLSTNGYEVIEARDGEEAIEAVVREHPHVILLDANMPGMTGFETCSKMRASFEGPIIMVTVRVFERDKIEAFNCGADDYIVKPFTMGELLARIRAALRHSQFGKALPRIDTEELKVDLEARTVDVRGSRAHLTPKEFEVLRTLVIQEGKAVPYGRILKAVWGPDYGEEIEKVRGVIKEIRKKIEKDPAHPRYIVTEPWLGYRFQVPNGSEESSHKK